MNKTTLLLLSTTLAFGVHAEQCRTPEGFVEATNTQAWDYPTSSKVALINLWAVWCPPCLRELPMLDSIATQPNFTIETIHIGDNSTAVDAKFSELDIQHLPKNLEPTFDLLHDWGFHGLPATMITINGQVKYGYSGYIRNDVDELKEWLNCLGKTN
tara:strand:- start:5751 stop:6221 length:471 start_codon:yes stop_codon:yes gene_type:complete